MRFEVCIAMSHSLSVAGMRLGSAPRRAIGIAAKKFARSRLYALAVKGP
jgi:hypothetical protein